MRENFSFAETIDPFIGESSMGNIIYQKIVTSKNAKHAKDNHIFCFSKLFFALLRY
jgi:hypothetical protein